MVIILTISIHRGTWPDTQWFDVRVLGHLTDGVFKFHGMQKDGQSYIPTPCERQRISMLVGCKAERGNIPHRTNEW